MFRLGLFGLDMAGNKLERGFEMEYKWRDGSRMNVTAQKVGAAIERIVEREGSVTPESLVASARSSRSTIHKLFDWDDQHAADSWRKHQARNVLGDLRVIVESDGEEIPVIAYVSVTVDNSPAYVTSAKAMSEEEYRQEVLNDALRALSGFQRRYNDLLELKPVFDAINTVRTGSTN